MCILIVTRTSVNFQKGRTKFIPLQWCPRGSSPHTLTNTVLSIFCISAKLFEDSQVFHGASGCRQLPMPTEAKVCPCSGLAHLLRFLLDMGSIGGAVKLRGDGPEMLGRPLTLNACPPSHPSLENCQIDRIPLLPEAEDPGEWNFLTCQSWILVTYTRQLCLPGRPQSRVKSLLCVGLKEKMCEGALHGPGAQCCPVSREHGSIIITLLAQRLRGVEHGEACGLLLEASLFPKCSHLVPPGFQSPVQLPLDFLSPHEQVLPLGEELKIKPIFKSFT